METCFHCGDPCLDNVIAHQQKNFCCHGCKTVFDILNDNDLSYYYDLEQTPGISPLQIEGKFDFLDNKEIATKFLEFDEQNTQIASFLIPSIHCSSCIWVLENLNKLNSNIKTSQVNFPEKTVRITFDSDVLDLKKVVLLLCKIGYEPYISLENFNAKSSAKDYSLIYKLGVAGFAFGNIMFLSFPEYFEVTEFWLEKFKHVFRWLMFAFSLPVVFYSSRDYFVSAIKGLRSKILNINIPIALGISVLFIRSTLEIVMDWGTGFFDSLSGLVFFLLLGKFFQQKTYSFLSFERDYKSYFPIAITRIINSATAKKTEEQTPVYELKKGDRIIIRNSELIPVDAILLKGNGLIDYSFVTGEAIPVTKISGDKVFAGGKQQAGIIELKVLKPVELSYLTQLWSKDVFNNQQQTPFETITDSISKRFTVGILSIAFLACIFWLVYDPSKALNVFTAVLIVACPCAIALAAPFTLGNLLRFFGKEKYYLKEANVLEKMALVDTVVFDKTGTLTHNHNNIITYEGIPLTADEEQLLYSTLRVSNHPLSRSLYAILEKNNISTLDDFSERIGEGVKATASSHTIKAGSYAFVTKEEILAKSNEKSPSKTTVHISSNNHYKGFYVFHNEYRKEITEVFKSLSQTKEVMVLSGDNAGEKSTLEKLVPTNTKLFFNQKPEDKLNFIKKLQAQGKNVMMIGDGLNDAGAIKQSDIGIAISENVNVFSPACDGILDASKFKNIPQFFKLSNKGTQIIKWSFILSLFYNLIGLSFAVTGHLKPIVAAILMPLSSISIVVFTTLSTYYFGNKILKK
ncbi:heavy metal translocating P-type ATPase [Aquimarina agarivorans]|uniref:heavy metal translocating P-type ATPase n=1 Tax=Aquimarina agarivorans TaxID=980584 RepID=UPI000248ED25|nr:heavy metal translocating P-type ATPase metal-binding domain-containing protein [Aquimarina agarivorans]